jgi:hypothetical protein
VTATARRNTLTSHYAPLVTFTARLLKSRRPQFFIDSVEELVSDGLIGLLKAIRDQRSRNGLDFRRRASLYIRHNIFNGAAHAPSRRTKACSPGRDLGGSPRRCARISMMPLDKRRPFEAVWKPPSLELAES